MSQAAAALAIPELRPRRPLWRVSFHLARRKPLGAIALAIIVIMIVLAIGAPAIAPQDPQRINSRVRFRSPGTSYLLGTDQLGRDVFSRIVWGARTSLWVGSLAVIIGIAVGAALGIVSGYFGGTVDMVVQRIADTFMAFPGLILLLTITLVLGSSLTDMFLALALLFWPGNCRVVRSAVLSVKQHVYVEAARAIGASEARIIFRHILPNVTAPIIILGSIFVGSAILLEASLKFLGLGADPTTPSWGSMLSLEGRTYMEEAPWLALAPGLAISLAVLAFNLFGDALRDIWDPRLRGT